MAYLDETIRQTRRDFFTSAASGLGAAALMSMLGKEAIASERKSVLPIRPPHFPARAKRCIFIFLAGGTSQVELFDPKPKLDELSGERLPDSLFGNERFSFIEKDKSFVMGSRFGFRRYGKCGMEMSELLPHIGSNADDLTLVRSLHTDEFDHGPAEIFFSTGVNTPGRPSAGAWITYGLGSESANLPGYVVLMTGRGPVSRSSTWSNAFLPATTGGVLLRNQGEPVLNLANPPGVSANMQRAELDAIAKLNRRRYEEFRDPEIQNRIDSYELAFRMQAAAPELIDFSSETNATHRAFGTQRAGEAGSFSRNCLLARRLVERGVRFVSLFHRRWDHHSGLHKKLEDGCRVVDQPIGALLKDLKQRGLLDDTLVVWGTEFGRTPVTQNAAVSAKAGRDHHRFGFSLWLAGGGARAGHVVGATDELGWRAVEDPVHTNDFHATLLHLMGLDHERLTYPLKGLDVRLTNLAGKVVPGIVS